jgi:hypothetical protein
MSTYLIVAYQTAGGRPLRDAIDGVTRQDPEADFKLLVPATRIEHLFTWTEGESNAVATKRAEKVAERLRQSGVRLTDVIVGDPDPFVAVSNELDRRPDYAAILVSTFPVGISRWLGIDLPSRLEKDTGLPVIHVIVDPEDSSSTP